jgi:hypothetical protein
MEDSEPSGEPRPQLGRPKSLLELSATIVTALGAVALATAFLYDSIYCLGLDRRLLGVYTIADHVETAVYCLLPIIFLSLYLAALPVAVLVADRIRGEVAARLTLMHRAGHKRAVILAMLFALATGLAAAYGTYRLLISIRLPPATLEAVWAAIAILLLLALLTWLAWPRLSHRTFMALAVSQLRVLPLLWIAVTIFLAATQADKAMRELTSGRLQSMDAVMLVGQGQLFGRVIKVVDKGLILGVQGEVRFMIIPKERVSRVDLASRPSIFELLLGGEM